MKSCVHVGGCDEFALRPAVLLVLERSMTPSPSPAPASMTPAGTVPPNGPPSGTPSPPLQPGTASGVVFITIEDETGTANLVVFNGIFEAYRKVILQSRLLMVEGKLQIEGEVVHVIVKHCHNLSPLLRDLVTPAARNFK